MIPINKVITIVFIAIIVGCSPSNTGQNFLSFNFLQSESDILNNTLIIPGKQVGAVTSKTTRADLVKMFGESKLKDDVLLEDEGTISVPVTKVNLDDGKSFTVAWEEDTREKLLYVRDFGSVWKIPEGIGVGTSFQELQKKLGDFRLTGLGWDYGGFINLETTNLSKYQGQLSLQLAPDQEAIKKNPQQHEAVLGDRELSSTNPHWQALNMKVSQMTVHLDD
ncbi:hypothetical protein NIES267_26300 [Calothrix parasitica NIES-267]|uniref:Lipoprotein n=1 Tax=Calothrix parasitica NIES-267 TaxID=1973488 RepID=A0A1Z4LPK9_9CYAN|nr:hypothetical protein NIES267_26300 [Calothrix parasitica NIES-267]